MNGVQIGAVVLAAGLSCRMGFTDKLMLPVGGVPMYQHAVRLACTCGYCSEVVVVTNNPEIAAFAQSLGARVVANPQAEYGIGTSVAVGCHALSQNTQAALFLSADQPFLTRDIIRTLSSGLSLYDSIMVPVVGNRTKSSCIFPRRYFDELNRLSADEDGKAVYLRHMDDVTAVNLPDGPEWRDIDTIGDYSGIAST